MNHYCTYFDSGYIAQGLALLRSLERHDPSHVVWVLCLDSDTHEVLNRLCGKSVRLLKLSDLVEGDVALSNAREDRSWVEFLFTLSPVLPLHVLKQDPSIEVVTYIDADMWLMSDVAPLFAELGSDNVLIVEHGFPAWLKHHEVRGKYNVGVLCFRNNEEGVKCLEWWRECCLEWCRDVVEQDRYADQKYLDRWPELFVGVKVCTHAGVNVAPWNWMTRRWGFDGDGGLTVDGQALVVFHFAALRFLENHKVDSSQVEYAVMPQRLRKGTYVPYLQEVFAMGEEIRGILPRYSVLRKQGRESRARWRTTVMSILFGAIWKYRAGRLVSRSLGLGRWSGRLLATIRSGGDS